MNYCTRCGRWAHLYEQVCDTCLVAWLDDLEREVARLVQLAPLPEGAP